jgi:hypothetical protein
VPNDMMRVRTSWVGVVTGPAVSTHYFLSATSPDAAMSQAVVDRVRDFWIQMGAVIYGGVTWTVSGQVDSLDYVSGALNSSQLVTSRTGVGTASGGTEPLPSPIQGLLRLETGTIVNSKRFRGRLFIPGITEIYSNPNPTTPVFTAGTAAVAAANGSTTFPWVVWHRPPTSGVGHTGGLVRAIVSGGIQPKWAVLRSRRD